MRRQLFGLALGGALVIGLASNASAQFSVSVGNPYTGQSFAVSGGATPYGYGVTTYNGGYPGYAAPSVAVSTPYATTYSSGYGIPPVGGVTSYSSGYGPGMTSYSSGYGVYGAPGVSAYYAPTTVVRPPVYAYPTTYTSYYGYRPGLFRPRVWGGYTTYGYRPYY